MSNEVSFFKLWFRWSIVFSSLVALGWGIYAICGGSVPSIRGLSRWWDVASPAIIVAGILSAFWVEEKYSGRMDTCLGLAALLGTGSALLFGILEGVLGVVASMVGVYVLYAIGWAVVCVCALIACIPFGRGRSFGQWLCGA